MTLEKTVQKYRALFKNTPAVLPAHEPKGHFYVSPKTQEKYHSVTYFTSFIKDPSLANWRMNRALAYVEESLKELRDQPLDRFNFPRTDLDQILTDAKSAPEGQFQLAGDIGSQTHAWRQEWFSAWINTGQMQLRDEIIDQWPLPENADPEVISGCRAIKKFLKETGAIPVACELALVDDELRVGGTVDDLMVFPNLVKAKAFDENNGDWIDGKYYIKDAFKTVYKPYLGFVDLKTSNQGKKPAYAFQVRGFYQRMIRKTFRVRPKKTYILHTSKDDGTYKLIDLTDMKFLEKDAEYLVHCSRSWDKVQEAFKPKVITI